MVSDSAAAICGLATTETGGPKRVVAVVRTHEERDDLILTRSSAAAATYCARGIPALSVTLAGDSLAFAAKAARVLFGGRVAIAAQDNELAREAESCGLDVASLP